MFNQGNKTSVKLPENLADYWRVEAWQEHTHAMEFAIYELQDSQPAFQGHIKWDGCSNWNTECIHFCSKPQFLQLSQLLECCFDFAAKNLDTFDEDSLTRR